MDYSEVAMAKALKDHLAGEVLPVEGDLTTEVLATNDGAKRIGDNEFLLWNGNDLYVVTVTKCKEA
jgi:hypothetical protein